MKKTGLAILLALVVLFAFAGCGSKNDDGDDGKEKAAGNGSGAAQNGETPADDEANTPEAKTSLPPEITESGYLAVKNGDVYYTFYAVIIKNPNADTAVEDFSFSITARDGAGAVLGTQTHKADLLYPLQNAVIALAGPMLEQEPASLDFEIIPPDDYAFVSVDTLEHPQYAPLSVDGVDLRREEPFTVVTGDISNPNDYDVDSAEITIVYRDGAGKLIAGDTWFIGEIPAKGKLPFKADLISNYATDQYEVYGSPW
ncbi:MAG: hypothetical protein LBO81_00820 [Clostridiales Family XIII bacterium]|jgi:hypothetical protein|nr:hypothetical protein [Clostridiales Family XIII bacterium]